jgi:methyl-accepting chemotaxis protein
MVSRSDAADIEATAASRKAQAQPTMARLLAVPLVYATRRSIVAPLNAAITVLRAPYLTLWLFALT